MTKKGIHVTHKGIDQRSEHHKSFSIFDYSLVAAQIKQGRTFEQQS